MIWRGRCWAFQPSISTGWFVERVDVSYPNLNVFEAIADQIEFLKALSSAFQGAGITFLYLVRIWIIATQKGWWLSRVQDLSRWYCQVFVWRLQLLFPEYWLWSNQWFIGGSCCWFTILIFTYERDHCLGDRPRIASHWYEILAKHWLADRMGLCSKCCNYRHG